MRIFVRIVNIIRVKLFLRLFKKFYFTFNNMVKMDLIKLADIILIFGIGLIEKSSLSSFNTALGIIR